MDYIELVTSLECEASEYPGERIGELCAQVQKRLQLSTIEPAS